LRFACMKWTMMVAKKVISISCGGRLDVLKVIHRTSDPVRVQIIQKEEEKSRVM
jgi:hypothetical protein